MTPPWERSLVRSMELVRNSLEVYLRTDTFYKEWNSYNFIRTDVKWLIICGSFVYNNKLTKLMAEIIYNVLIFRLNVTSVPYDSVVGNTVENMKGTWIYRDLLSTYKDLWHYAEYIQIRWRRAISSPEYKLCRDRLAKEFKKMG